MARSKPSEEMRPANDSRSLVPAVQRAARVLSLLLEETDGATLSAIAKGAELSISTASNLLRTMAEEGVLAYDADTRRYNLGPRLVVYGAAATARTPPLVLARPHMNRIADETGLASLCIQRLPDGEFIAVQKTESRRDIKVTIEVGERFPYDSPLLSRLWNAWRPDHSIAPTRAFTGTTLTDTDEVNRAMEGVRQQGIVAVYGEYISNLNVVGVPVFGADAMPCLGITVLGMGHDLQPGQVERLRPSLVAAARDITLSSGGRLPPDYPEPFQPVTGHLPHDLDPAGDPEGGGGMPRPEPT